MTRYQADHILAPFIQDHHRRILSLIPEQGGDLAHHNPGRHDEDQPSKLLPQSGDHRPQAVKAHRPQSYRKPMPVRYIAGTSRQVCLDLQGQVDPVPGNGDDGNGKMMRCE